MNVFRNDFQRFTDDINGLIIKMIRFRISRSKLFVSIDFNNVDIRNFFCKDAQLVVGF